MAVNASLFRKKSAKSYLGGGIKIVRIGIFCEACKKLLCAGAFKLQERCGAYEQLSAAAFYFKDRAEIMVAVEVVDRADDRIYRQTVKYHSA